MCRLRATCLGVLDTRAFEVAAEERWWPALRERYPLDAFGSHTLDALLVHLVHHRVVESDDLLAEYPSHLHIDLLPPLQGGWLGSAAHGPAAGAAGRARAHRACTSAPARPTPGPSPSTSTSASPAGATTGVTQ